MFRYFEQLSTRIAAPFMAHTSRNGKVWQCRCGQSLFFRNSQCLACQAVLGYQPQQSRLSSLQPGPVVDTWLADDNLDAGAFRRCANLDTPAACNWLIPAHSNASLCVACSLNRTIPDLSIPENPERWRKVETAKRRLVNQSSMSVAVPSASCCPPDQSRNTSRPGANPRPLRQSPPAAPTPESPAQHRPP